MRILTACLAGFLGLGALTTVPACSDSSDDMGTAGSAGNTGASAGSGGAAGDGGSSSGDAGSAGSSSGDAGAGGAAECGFTQDACVVCLSASCLNEYTECQDDDACDGALDVLPGCVCDPSKTDLECQVAFVSDGGDLAQTLATCFSENCTEACQ